MRVHLSPLIVLTERGASGLSLSLTQTTSCSLALMRAFEDTYAPHTQSKPYDGLRLALVFVYGAARADRYLDLRRRGAAPRGAQKK